MLSQNLVLASKPSVQLGYNLELYDDMILRSKKCHGIPRTVRSHPDVVQHAAGLGVTAEEVWPPSVWSTPSIRSKNAR